MTNPVLSVIVIGRNEQKGLPRLHESLAPLLQSLPCETLYVDSASSDASVATACVCFDLCVELVDSMQLNASAGRYAGVSMAKGSWLLFLDGDMVLLPEIVNDLVAHIRGDFNRQGLIGRYVHRYDDDSTKTWVPRRSVIGDVDHFGGAVMLPASALALENWNPGLYSNEEIDLHSRLRARGYSVRFVDKDFIQHDTEHFGRGKTLKGNFIAKDSFLGKKFFGFGQLLRSRVADGNLGTLIRWFPEPFIGWLGWIALAVIFCAGPGLIPLLIFAGALAFVSIRKSPRFFILYAAFAVQAVQGWGRLARSWRPEVRAVHRRRHPPS